MEGHPQQSCCHRCHCYWLTCLLYLPQLHALPLHLACCLHSTYWTNVTKLSRQHVVHNSGSVNRHKTEKHKSKVEISSRSGRHVRQARSQKLPIEANDCPWKFRLMLSYSLTHRRGSCRKPFRHIRAISPPLTCASLQIQSNRPVINIHMRKSVSQN